MCLRNDLTRWAPWIAVFVGSITLFTHGVLVDLPAPVSHALGSQIVAQAWSEFILLLAFCFLQGRLFILILLEPLIALVRFFTLQLPLQFLTPFSGRIKRKRFRIFWKLRWSIDRLLILVWRYPAEASVLVGIILFAIQWTHSWRFVGSLLFALILVGTTANRIRRIIETGYRVKLAHRVDTRRGLGNLRQVSYSTVFLFASYFSGWVYLDKLIEGAVLTEPDSQIVFVGGNYSLLIDRDAVDRSTVLTWKLADTDELKLAF